MIRCALAHHIRRLHPIRASPVGPWSGCTWPVIVIQCGPHLHWSSVCYLWRYLGIEGN